MTRASSERMRSFFGCLLLVACAACVETGSSDQGDTGGKGAPGGSSSSGGANGGVEGTSGSSNTPDTCTGGDNMSAPRLVGEPTAGEADTTLLHIAWDVGTDRGATLPSSYFEKVRLYEGSLVTKTEPAGEREMILTLTGAPASHAGKTEKLSLGFSDRRDFIECTHGGMPDSYALTVTVTFSADGTTATATFEQGVALGDY